MQIVDPLGACQPYTAKAIMMFALTRRPNGVPEGVLADLAAVSTGVHERQRSDMQEIAHAVKELASLAHLPTELEVVQSRAQSPTAKIDSRSYAMAEDNKKNTEMADALQRPDDAYPSLISWRACVLVNAVAVAHSRRTLLLSLLITCIAKATAVNLFDSDSVPADIVFPPSSFQLRLRRPVWPECNVSLLSRTLWAGREGQALAVSL
eukprot:2523335-Amphidinium_carterae.3